MKKIKYTTIKLFSYLKYDGLYMPKYYNYESDRIKFKYVLNFI